MTYRYLSHIILKKVVLKLIESFLTVLNMFEMFKNIANKAIASELKINLLFMANHKKFINYI